MEPLAAARIWSGNSIKVGVRTEKVLPINAHPPTGWYDSVSPLLMLHTFHETRGRESGALRNLTPVTAFTGCRLTTITCGRGRGRGRSGTGEVLRQGWVDGEHVLLALVT